MSEKVDFKPCPVCLSEDIAWNDSLVGYECQDCGTMVPKWNESRKSDELLQAFKRQLAAQRDVSNLNRGSVVALLQQREQMIQQHVEDLREAIRWFCREQCCELFPAEEDTIDKLYHELEAHLASLKQPVAEGQSQSSKDT